MSNTDFLRKTEADFLPHGFIQGQIFHFTVNGYQGSAEVDGWNEETGEAIEICQSESDGSPKPGQKRKMASDALKLIFLIDQGLILSGKIFVTSQEMYTWFHQSGSWLSAACRHHHIGVELKHHSKKMVRKRIRNVMRQAQRERPSL